MCLETMDTRSKLVKPDLLRKARRPGSNLRWRLLRVSTGAVEDEEPNKQGRTNSSAVKATIRKYLRGEQRRTQLAKLTKILGEIGKKEKNEAVCGERPAKACVDRHPAGAMAPANTTQYLMSNVYEDIKTNVQAAPAAPETSAQLYGEGLSPRGVYIELDSSYESCLAFQQRDFEEMFDSSW